MQEVVRQKVAEQLEAYVNSAIAKSGRKCGQCSLCCKLLPINEDDFVKKEDTWCEHCTKPGCAIYEERPRACRTWACKWLTTPMMDEYWYPAKAKMVVAWWPLLRSGNLYEIIVDPGFPGRWREEPWYSDIKGLSRMGLTGGGKSGLTWRTKVTVGQQQWLVLPDYEVKVADSDAGIILPIGEENGETLFRYLKCKDEAMAQKLLTVMGTIRSWAQNASEEDRASLLADIQAEVGETGVSEADVARLMMQAAE
jgi:hypothetical protein